MRKVEKSFTHWHFHFTDELSVRSNLQFVSERFHRKVDMICNLGLDVEYNICIITGKIKNTMIFSCIMVFLKQILSQIGNGEKHTAEEEL